MKLKRLERFWKQDMEYMRILSTPEYIQSCPTTNGAELTMSDPIQDWDISKEDCQWKFCDAISEELQPLEPLPEEPLPKVEDPRCKMGKWSPWGWWDNCKDKCGQPEIEWFRTRKRRCEKIAPCLKKGEVLGTLAENCTSTIIKNRVITDTETARCTHFDCPKPTHPSVPSWSPWGPFSPDNSCGPGLQSRTRTCLLNGKPFFGGCPDISGFPAGTEKDCSLSG